MEARQSYNRYSGRSKNFEIGSEEWIRQDRLSVVYTIILLLESLSWTSTQNLLYPRKEVELKMEEGNAVGSGRQESQQHSEDDSNTGIERIRRRRRALEGDRECGARSARRNKAMSTKKGEEDKQHQKEWWLNDSRRVNIFGIKEEEEWR